MLLVTGVQDDKRISGVGHGVVGLEKLKTPRSVIPAVTHVDYSARLQTVDAERHGLYYRVIRAFEDQTDCPLVINTSFNVRGEPIVCTPEDAYHCFMGTHMDVLVIENFVLEKGDQPDGQIPQNQEYLAQFSLD